LLDETRALEAAGQDQQFLAELAKLLGQVIGDRLPKLMGAADLGDVEAVRLEAHSMRGAAANIGARRLEGAALELEEACDRHDSAALGRSAASLVTALKETREFLLERFPNASNDEESRCPAG
jgi:HPt (histidine-containing phosphotransfer) domain-containing protein